MESRRDLIKKRLRGPCLDAEEVEAAKLFWIGLSLDEQLAVLRFDDATLVHRLQAVWQHLSVSDLTCFLIGVQGEDENMRYKNMNMFALDGARGNDGSLQEAVFLVQRAFLRKVDLFDLLENKLGSSFLQGRKVMKRQEWPSLFERTPHSWAEFASQIFRLLEVALRQAQLDAPDPALALEDEEDDEALSSSPSGKSKSAKNSKRRERQKRTKRAQQVDGQDTETCPVCEGSRQLLGDPCPLCGEDVDELEAEADQGMHMSSVPSDVVGDARFSQGIDLRNASEGEIQKESIAEAETREGSLTTSPQKDSSLDSTPVASDNESEAKAIGVELFSGSDPENNSEWSTVRKVRSTKVLESNPVHEAAAKKQQQVQEVQELNGALAPHLEAFVPDGYHIIVRNTFFDVQSSTEFTGCSRRRSLSL